jgi:hypothetical protein
MGGAIGAVQRSHLATQMTFTLCHAVDLHARGPRKRSCTCDHGNGFNVTLVLE